MILLLYKLIALALIVCMMKYNLRAAENKIFEINIFFIKNDIKNQ